MRKTLSAVLLFAATAGPAPAAPAHLTAQAIDSGFPLSGFTFNGIACASDGNIYYVLCSESIDRGAQMYRYRPETGEVSHLGDLTEAAGEKGLKAVPQGKSHVTFAESRGKLYFATHVDYYANLDGLERMRPPPPGYHAYPGGHFLSYEMASGKFENIAKAPSGEGILAMSMDAARGRLYGLTWPSGYFLRCDLATRQVRSLGRTSKEGEAGRGANYRVLCRSLAVDPRDGAVYFTTADGEIRRYDPGRDALETITGETMRKDYFGCYDAKAVGSMGYNWRQTAWCPAEGVFYGVHGGSGYLFRFDPRVPRIDLLERIASEPSKRSGMRDKFRYGYLGFALGPDGHTVFYLTGGPIGPGEKKGGPDDEDLRLVTYDLRAGTYSDRGAVFLEGPQLVNSIALGRDGSVYALSGITEGGHTRTDLIRIRPR